MRSKTDLLIYGIFVFLLAGHTQRVLARPLPPWQPRLFVAGTGVVWSPGGDDKDRFATSMGGGLSVNFWLERNMQLMLSAYFAPLKTHRFYWMPATLQDTPPDVWEVEGSLWTISAEWRRLYAADNVNFLYFGLGLDYVHQGPVEGSWERYGPTIDRGTISQQPPFTDALSVHVSPGLFFLYHPKVSMDVSVRLFMFCNPHESPITQKGAGIFNTSFAKWQPGKFHLNWPIWIQPNFSLGFSVPSLLP